jgi:hypothetical protein
MTNLRISTLLSAAALSLALAGGASAQSLIGNNGGVSRSVDASSYNVGGPEVTNETMPASISQSVPKPSQADQARQQAELALQQDGTEATSHVLYNTAGPGALAGLNPSLREGRASEPRAVLEAEDAAHRVDPATEATSGSIYNTSGPGALAGMNPGVAPTASSSQLAAANHTPAARF